jgi:halocyanin-like protein
MTEYSVDRRTMIRATGLTMAAGALAGCGGGGGGGGDDTTDGGDDDTTDGNGGDVPSEVSSYLSETDNFDGSVTDMTGQSEVTVMVGAEGNDGNYAFSPPAIRISTGTTVLFEWTGMGSSHNVVSDGDGPLDSGESVSQSGVNYEYTFEETGIYNYYCVPHEALGMKGSIVVE